MAYVPPALRKKQNEPASKPPAVQHPAATNNLSFHRRERLPRAEDVHDYYWPPADGDNGDYYWPPADGDNGDYDNPKADQGVPGMRSGAVHSTLNSARSDPHHLRYVMLFQDANPRWQSDRIIYVKTNLHLLPGSEKFAEFTASTGAGESDVDAAHEKHDPAAEINAEDDEESKKKKKKKENSVEHQPVQPLASTRGEPATNPPDETPHSPDLSAYQLDPVAVFEQVGTGTRGGGGFRFAGYHRLARLQFIEPRSADLVRMLEHKFSVADRFGRVVRQQRSPEAWKASLEHRWAVLGLERDEGVERELGAPVVSVRQQRERGVPPMRRKEEEAAAAADEEMPKKSVNELLREMRLKNDGGEVR